MVEWRKYPRKQNKNLFEMMAIWSKKVSKLEDLSVPERRNREYGREKIIETRVSRARGCE